jgi:hypothetical protein
MTTKMLSVGVTVDPAETSTLTVLPATSSLTLTVGKDAPSIPIAKAIGGVPPYTVAAAAGSAALPDGVTFVIDKAGMVYPTGTPTTASTSTEQILLDISDSAGSTVTATVPAAPASKKSAGTATAAQWGK